MRERWQEVCLGEVATENKTRVRLVDGTIYPAAGVLRDGKGLLEREPFVGGETTYKKLTPLSAGQLVLRSITAWEAPVAVVNPEYEGRHVSGVFPVFDLDRSRIVPAFMGLLCQYPRFWHEMRIRTTGTVMRRKTLSAAAFLDIPVRLPPMPTQRRIVDLISSLDNLIACVHAEGQALTTGARALRGRIFSEMSESTSPASEMFDMLLGRQKSARQSAGDHVIPYIRSANIADGDLRLDDLQAMNFSPDEQTKYCLGRDDVLLVEGGNVGLAARWSEQVAGPVGFDKHVIRLRAIPGVSTSEYALQWAKWSRESGAFDRQATGITIRALGFARASGMSVPRISPSEQDAACRPLVALDDALRAQREVARCLNEARTGLLRDLLGGAHEMPESYDQLLEAVE